MLIRLRDLAQFVESDSKNFHHELMAAIKIAIEKDELIPRTEAGFPISVGTCVDKASARNMKKNSEVAKYLNLPPREPGSFSTPIQDFMRLCRLKGAHESFAKGLIEQEYVASYELQEWLQSMGFDVETGDHPPGSFIAAETTSASTGKTPRDKQRRQEKKILEVLKALGYTSNALPRNQSGKPGVKHQCWEQAKEDVQLFGTQKTFNSAWERLRADCEIADAFSTPPSKK